MSTIDKPSATSDEKLMAALAHIFGPLAVIIIWVLQKDKSRFEKFQALQALTFDVIISLTTSLIFLCIFGAAFLGVSTPMFGAVNDPSSSRGFETFFFLPFMFPSLIFVWAMPLSFIFLRVRLVASISILNGKNHHYPLIGTWLENFMDA